MGQRLGLECPKDLHILGSIEEVCILFHTLPYWG